MNFSKGEVWRIRSRNLTIGVFDGDEGFIGIRTKFESRLLFTEYLAREHGGTKHLPFDTVTPIERVGQVPEGIEITDHLGSVCQCGSTSIRWTGPPAPAPWECDDCDEPLSFRKPNNPLFDYLDKLEG